MRKSFWRKRLTIPTGSKFIRAAKIRKHRLQASGDPILILTIDVDGEQIKYAIHQGLAWQLVRDIRKAIGFSESELDAAQHIGRWGGNV
jgi:hypothetical protein